MLYTALIEFESEAESMDEVKNDLGGLFAFEEGGIECAQIKKLVRGGYATYLKKFNELRKNKLLNQLKGDKHDRKRECFRNH